MIESPYNLPDIYEIAFSFRDYPQAVDAITDICAKEGITTIESVAELGAGPGQYCREFARRNVSSYGIDICPEMVDYINTSSKRESLECKGLLSDMRSFALPEKVDLAVCMMATFEHLVTNDDVIRHLDSVANNLAANGLYIAELSHPRDVLTTASSTQNRWTLQKDGTTVTTVWGDKGSTFDPVTEISDVAVSYLIEREGQSERLESRCRTRQYTSGLIHALVQLSGRFKVSNMYGDLDVNQQFDNSEKSWRMVVVLKKMK